MEIIKSYKTEVIYPDGMLLIEDSDGIVKPWCEKHEEYYYKCDCPKPDSTPEKDGWYVDKNGEKLNASPTRDRYEAMALWIEVDGDIMRCNKCGEELDINEFDYVSKMLNELVYLKILDIAVDSFFDIHAERKNLVLNNGDKYLMVHSVCEDIINFNIIKIKSETEI